MKAVAFDTHMWTRVRVQVTKRASKRAALWKSLPKPNASYQKRARTRSKTSPSNDLCKVASTRYLLQRSRVAFFSKTKPTCSWAGMIGALRLVSGLVLPGSVVIDDTYFRFGYRAALTEQRLGTANGLEGILETPLFERKRRFDRRKAGKAHDPPGKSFSPRILHTPRARTEASPDRTRFAGPPPPVGRRYPLNGCGPPVTRRLFVRWDLVSDSGHLHPPARRGKPSRSPSSTRGSCIPGPCYGHLGSEVRAETRGTCVRRRGGMKRTPKGK